MADRRDLAEGTVGKYMTWEPATVGLETPLAEVAHRMLAFGVGHLPVVVAGDVIGDSVGQRPAGTRTRHQWLTRGHRSRRFVGGLPGRLAMGASGTVRSSWTLQVSYLRPALCSRCSWG